MPKRGLPKKIRQKLLLETIAEDPFLNDEELAERFNVSVQTIRLDRMELKLPELRERIRAVAQDSYAKVKSIDVSEMLEN